MQASLLLVVLNGCQVELLTRTHCWGEAGGLQIAQAAERVWQLLAVVTHGCLANGVSRHFRQILSKKGAHSLFKSHVLA